jgi:hypothetical protein
MIYLYSILLWFAVSCIVGPIVGYWLKEKPEYPWTFVKGDRLEAVKGKRDPE